MNILANQIRKMLKWYSRTIRISFCVLLGIVVMAPTVLYGDVWFKSEERTGVQLALEPISENSRRFRVQVNTVPETNNEEKSDITSSQTFTTRFFYDELASVRKIVVIEENQLPVWEMFDKTERLVVDFYRDGTPRRLIEKIASIGGREWVFDRFGRIVEQTIFFYQTVSEANTYENNQLYRVTRTFKEVYVYHENLDIVIEKDVYEDGKLHYKRTRTLPVQTKDGETFRENYFDAKSQLAYYDTVLRTTISPTSYKEKRMRYESNRKLIETFSQYYYEGKIVRKVINDEQEITYAYDELGRLKEKKRENLLERAIAQYYEYEYYPIQGLNSPLIFKAPLFYTLENLKLYIEDEILEQYRFLRIYGMNPIKMIMRTQSLSERDRYPDSIVETRVEKIFLPKKMLTYLFNNRVLMEKQIHTLNGRILGHYQYKYDSYGRLTSSIFSEANAPLNPQTKTVRYLYKEPSRLDSAISSSGILFRTGNWEYFGHSLFRYLEANQRYLAQLSTKDFIMEFTAFRSRNEEIPSGWIEALSGHATETNVFTYLKYLTQTKLSRILFINEEGSVEYYLKLKSFPIEGGLEQFSIRYYKGEPQFQYERARKIAQVLKAFREDGFDNSNQRVSVLRGERQEFLTNGSLELNEAYAERLLAQFTFVYNPASVLSQNKLDKEDTYKKRLPIYAKRQLYTHESRRPINETIIERSAFLKHRTFSRENNQYEEDFEKKILPFIK